MIFGGENCKTQKFRKLIFKSGFFFFFKCKNYTWLTIFFGRWELLYIPKNERQQQEFSLKIHIFNRCRFFFSSATLNAGEFWRIECKARCKITEKKSVDTIRKWDSSWGAEMLSSIQRKCHEMNFKRNDNFFASLHTVPFWSNLRHLSS